MVRKLALTHLFVNPFGDDGLEDRLVYSVLPGELTFPRSPLPAL
jgi:hypothetical protein